MVLVEILVSFYLVAGKYLVLIVMIYTILYISDISCVTFM